MKIPISKRLTYKELKVLMTQHYQRSLTADHTEIHFDWNATEWVSLPEIVSLLSWSSKLVHLGKHVKWLFRDPRSPVDGIDDIRFNVKGVLGSERYDRFFKQLDRLQQSAIGGKLYPRVHRLAVQQMRDEARIKCSGGISDIEHWLSLEASALVYMDLLAYLDRYKVFDRAAEAGIAMLPDPRRLPKSSMARTPSTACLELRPVQSLVEAGLLVDELDNSQELTRVLGEFANLDVVQRGAFSQILVAELGQNVGEHSNGSAAWLCTRLVMDESVVDQTEGDPAVEPFRTGKLGFLEVIVCDNGDGLTQGLEDVLDRDRRETVRSKYTQQEDGHFESRDLVDYAFDRLSSTKRDIVQLIHLAEQPGSERRVAASGLYWVWNVVRSHRGVLAVRTHDVCGWYDFTGETVIGGSAKWEMKSLAVDESRSPFCGTMLRVCLPIREKRVVGNRLRTPQSFRIEGELNSSNVTSPKIVSVFIRDLSRRAHLSYPRGKPKSIGRTSQQQFPGMEGSHESRVLRELQREHFPLKDGDMLVLDLCDIRGQWINESILALCHFFLEMNYTSTVGRSAVVLWNVPSSLEELFDLNIALAMGPYRHLQDFRRAALLVRDDGKMRIFCGWPEAERILAKLEREGDLDLNEMSVEILNREEKARLRRFVSDNSHLFEWKDNDRVRLRPWPIEIRAAAWRQHMDWFVKLLVQGVAQGWALLNRTHGYYRLPSTGFLVKEFFQFGGVLSNHASCTRVAWLLTQVLGGIQRQHSVRWLVSVTRSTMPLTRLLLERYNLAEGQPFPQVLAESTVEELELKARTGEVQGKALLITDVISSGTLCKQIKQALPHVEWVGTIALLDTRDDAHDADKEPEVFPLDLGIKVYKTKSVDTGEVYTLALRKIQKTHPASAAGEPIQAIDKVNVCPVQGFDRFPYTRHDIWPFLESKGDAMQVGHHASGYHHYIYYVNAQELLGATDLSDGRSLLEHIVGGVVGDLGTSSHEPDKIVIMHPPRETSYAEIIAREVQDFTGALHRLVFYRDMFAGQWRFSPLIEHGVDLRGRTVVLIDDGSNTGETLMGLLDAAAFWVPKRILAYVGIARMPLHKLDLLSRITSFRGDSKTSVVFEVGLNIPVFTPRTCPICRFRNGLSQVSSSSPLLWRYAKEMIKETEALTAGSKSREHSRAFLWSPARSMSAARLRESLELMDYHAESSAHVETVIREVVHPNSKSAGNDDPLLDLAFVVCAEPDVVTAPVFVPCLEGMLQTAIKRIRYCPDKELMTVIGFSLYLMLQIYRRRADADLDKPSNDLWEALLNRDQVTIPLVGRILAVAVGEALSDQYSESDPQRKVLRTWANKLLLMHLDRIQEKDKLVRAFGRLFAREIVGAARGGLVSQQHLGESATPDLYTLAVKAAEKFFWHASEFVDANIDNLQRNALQENDGGDTDPFYGPIYSLVQAFEELQELRYSLCEAEHRAEKLGGEVPGASTYWNSPQLVSAMDAFGNELITLAEEVEKSSGRDRSAFRPIVEKLSNMKPELNRLLNPAFDAIFPEVVSAVTAHWNDHCANFSGLPDCAIGTAALRVVEPRAQVFIPRTLLHRFLSVAMENLGTAAFQSWPSKQISNDAKANLEISSLSGVDGAPMVLVKIVDNGRKFPPAQAKGKSQSGLNDVKRMCVDFGADLRLPKEGEGDTTVVELLLRQRPKGQ